VLSAVSGSSALTSMLTASLAALTLPPRVSVQVNDAVSPATASADTVTVDPFRVMLLGLFASAVMLVVP